MTDHLPIAIVFDTFGSVVDWRGSIERDLSAWALTKGIEGIDWGKFAFEWRRAYHPSLDKVRSGQEPFQPLDVLHRRSLEVNLANFGITGLGEEDLQYLTYAWHRLSGWPDSVPGLTRLKTKFIISPMSNGNVRLLTSMAKFAGLPWDLILGADVFGHYKPAPETYLGAAKLLGVEPGRVMMAAAHNRDLAVARSLGLMTAFFPRPQEHGPFQRDDFAADQDWDIVAHDIEDLATKLGCD